MTTSSNEHTRGWTDIRTVGPALMILFGVVLMVAPLASVGAAGSVGNAGGEIPFCGPNDPECEAQLPTDCPPGGGNAGNAAFVAPDDCPPVTAPPSTAAPTTTAAPPTTAASVDEPVSVPVAPSVGDESVGAPDAVEPEVLSRTEAPDSPTSESVPTSAAGTAERSELAFTGPDGGTAIASALGALLVLGGATLLFLSRRRSI